MPQTSPINWLLISTLLTSFILISSFNQLHPTVDNNSNNPINNPINW